MGKGIKINKTVLRGIEGMADVLVASLQINRAAALSRTVYRWCV